MQFNSATLSALWQKLQAASKIVIVSHFNPDGDAVGSSLGWYHFLRSMGKNATVCLPNDFPAHFNFLPAAGDIVIASKNSEKSEDLFQQADLIFILDLNTPKRTGLLTPYIVGSKAVKVLIDHHVDPETTAFDLLFSTTETSSTSELIFRLTEAFTQGRNHKNKDMAMCLYTGISTDTGSLSYACNHADTYTALARLVEMGIVPEDINKKIYNNFSENRLRLLGYCISEKLVVNRDFGYAYMYLGIDELNRFDFQIGDTEGVVNYALKLSDTEVGILISERPTVTRLSFRSKGDFDVNLFARKYWKGGGHVKAAGGESNLPEKDLLKRLEELLKKEIEQQKQPNV